MSRILIYSDLHCSYTSSILPLYSKNTNGFTTRLQMIIDTGKWISDIAEKEPVDLIVNGGDTFDSILVKAEELSAVQKALVDTQEAAETSDTERIRVQTHDFMQLTDEFAARRMDRSIRRALAGKTVDELK